ncbi:MAG: alpha-ketoglutarate dehydrogenase [Proteobacteria bacterium]|nr:alpha-ketoglutarate dehydrogenase [Pseudomonadota bacterium]
MSQPPVAMRSEPDVDPDETREWLDAFDSVLYRHDPQRALFLLDRLKEHARQRGLIAAGTSYSAYRNTIPLEREAPYPGDLRIETRLTAIMRWNALAMVVRANRAYGELGGHIASYASAAEIFEVGFNHFFAGAGEDHGGDLVYYQPHSAPGIYARAFLEGRLTERELDHFRQEVSGTGLCSYPHPWLMPRFWQFPTGSMGIGPLNAIYQARFLRYLAHRGLGETSQRRVWGVFGDGEMDEPESLAALSLAAREALDNLTFIINCNLQRLDGPVRGNGQIIQELESLFAGAGWNVIKVLWSSDWDPLFARDTHNALLHQLSMTVDGAYQNLGARDGAYNIEHFFKHDPRIQSLIAHMSDDEIAALRRGGHDLRKLCAAFAAAKDHHGQPTVILAKTKKGFGMGGAGESRMTAHQAKKLDIEALKEFRDRFHLPLSDEDVAALRFYKPADDSPELRYLKERRAALGGPIPVRRCNAPALPIPPLDSYARFALAAEGKQMSSTMAAVRMLSTLLRDKQLGPRIVPIVADEARTFGMDNLFRQVGIYSHVGQLYQPEDAGSMLYYREASDGQLLEEGITEAGAMSSWIAAATSYSTHGIAMLPIYIYYSMFGFQRVGDVIWAAADQRARGFLFGATAGRTTLGGEGLQHQDGTSQLIASTVPNCRAYDPTFAYEVAVIVDHGMRRMLEQQVDEFYYITMMNENYPHPSMPPGIEASIIKGMYLCRPHGSEVTAGGAVQLLGSGAILREVLAAAELLENEWQTPCDVFSVTSFCELAREAEEVRRWNRLHPLQPSRQSHIATQLRPGALCVAATDYVRAYPQLIAQYIEGEYIALGTDGFGRSDTRQALRRFFEVDRHSVVIAALDGLARAGRVPATTVARAIEQYGLHTDGGPPWQQ